MREVKRARTRLTRPDSAHICGDILCVCAALAQFGTSVGVECLFYFNKVGPLCTGAYADECAACGRYGRFRCLPLCIGYHHFRFNCIELDRA